MSSDQAKSGGRTRRSLKSIFGVSLFESKPETKNQASSTASPEGRHPRRRSTALAAESDNSSSSVGSSEEQGKERTSRLQRLVKLVSPIKGFPSRRANRKTSKRDNATGAETNPSTKSEACPNGATALSSEQGEEGGSSPSAAGTVQIMHVEDFEMPLPGMVSSTTDVKVSNAKPVLCRAQILPPLTSGNGKEKLPPIPTIKERRKQEKKKKKAEAKKAKKAMKELKHKEATAAKELKKSKDSSKSKTDRDSPKSKTDKDSPKSKTDKDSPKSKTDKDSSKSKTVKDSSKSKMDKDSSKSKTDKDSSKSKNGKDSSSKAFSKFLFGKKEKRSIACQDPVSTKAERDKTRPFPIKEAWLPNPDVAPPKYCPAEGFMNVTDLEQEAAEPALRNLYSRYSLDISEGDKKPAGKEVTAEEAVKSVPEEPKPSEEGPSEYGDITLVKVKPIRGASGASRCPLPAHPSRRNDTIVKVQRMLQNEAGSGASGSTTRPLAARPGPRRSILENMQQRDMNDLTSITRRILASRAGTRRNSMLNAQKEEEENEQEKVPSQGRSMFTRPLGAHPNRRRSTTVSVQEQDPNHYYSRRARDDRKEEEETSREGRRFGTRVLAWE